MRIAIRPVISGIGTRWRAIQGKTSTLRAAARLFQTFFQIFTKPPHVTGSVTVPTLLPLFLYNCHVDWRAGDVVKSLCQRGAVKKQ